MGKSSLVNILWDKYLTAAEQSEKAQAHADRLHRIEQNALLDYGEESKKLRGNIGQEKPNG